MRVVAQSFLQFGLFVLAVEKSDDIVTYTLSVYELRRDFLVFITYVKSSGDPTSCEVVRISPSEHDFCQIVKEYSTYEKNVGDVFVRFLSPLEDFIPTTMADFAKKTFLASAGAHMWETVHANPKTLYSLYDSLAKKDYYVQKDNFLKVCFQFAETYQKYKTTNKIELPEKHLRPESID
jgi:hypothetical protein